MLNKQLRVKPQGAGQRLDVWLVNQIGNSRNYWQHLIKQGNIQINGASTKSSYQIERNDAVSIIETESLATANPAVPPIKVIYQDQYLLVVEKPDGLLTHPVPGQKPQATLAQFATAHTSDQDGERSGIVHRLDRETSGLIIIAKDSATKAYLQEQFRSRKVHKTYQLLVEGHLKQMEALIDLPIGRKSDTAKRAVMPNGKPAQTGYKVLMEYPKYSLVEAYPKTGRTHQLRVHFNHLGHPIVGDRFYGNPPPAGLGRMFLHASDLEFIGPDDRKYKLHSSLPPELQQFLVSLQ